MAGAVQRKARFAIVLIVQDRHNRETAAQQAEGRVRRRSMQATSLDVLPVLRRKGPAHPGQHLGGTAVISPPHVHCPSASRS